MPKIPSRNPVLFGNIGHITALLIVGSGVSIGFGHNHENLVMFRSLGDFVPLVRRNHVRIGSRLLRQVVRLRAHDIPCALGVVLRISPSMGAII